jgi:ankyrin repeat protein
MISHSIIVSSHLRDKKSPENILNAKDSYGHTILYVGCRNGNLQLVKLLIEMGADNNVQSNVKIGLSEGNLSVACR